MPAGPPAANREPLLSYPRTAVRFFLGDQEPTTEIMRNANRYYAAIASEKSFILVRNTRHVVEQTEAGVDALVSSVRAALK